MLYNAFQSARQSKSGPSRGDIAAPTGLSIPNCISISNGSTIFTQLMAESPYTSQRALKCD